MNSLSWFLYLADVIPGMFTPLIFVLGIFVFVMMIFFFIALATMADSSIGSGDYKKGQLIKNTTCRIPNGSFLFFS
jgi:hypothetical protein